jgi:hypothetical protein
MPCPQTSCHLSVHDVGPSLVAAVPKEPGWQGSCLPGTTTTTKCKAGARWREHGATKACRQVLLYVGQEWTCQALLLDTIQLFRDLLCAGQDRALGTGPSLESGWGGELGSHLWYLGAGCHRTGPLQ